MTAMGDTDSTYIDRHISLVKSAVIEIQNKNSAHLGFFDCYGYVKDLFRMNQLDRLLNEVMDLVLAHLDRVKSCVVASKESPNFLQTLQTAWDDHRECMTSISSIFNYAEMAGKCNVYNLGVDAFLTEVFRQEGINELVQRTVFQMLRDDRNGITVDRAPIRKILVMLKSLGTNNNRSIYEIEFEQPFLTETTEFYKMEGQQLIAENNASIFNGKVQSRLKHELNLLRDCEVDLNTRGRLQRRIQDHLIKAHMETLVDMPNSGVQHMMKNRKMDDLRRLYQLLRYIKSGVDVISDRVRNFLLSEREIQLKEESSKKNDVAVTFVKNMITLKDKLDYFLTHAFDWNSIIVQSVTSEFEKLINENQRAAQYLSLFIDHHLRNRQMSNEGIQEVCDKVISLFRFLADKDVFEQYFNRHSARRLLSKTSASHDNEASMLSKFKTECGTHFTNRFESMLKDIDVSKSYMTDFSSSLTQENFGLFNVDQFDILVLRTGTWPDECASVLSDVESIILPEAQAAAFNTFYEFYFSKHNCRTLRLDFERGTVDMEATFKEPVYSIITKNPSSAELDDHLNWTTPTPVKKRKIQHREKTYILQVSTMQMCILSHFNDDRDRSSFTDLQSATNIPQRELHQALLGLTTRTEDHEAVLLKEAETEAIEHHIYCVNESFKATSHRVKIHTPKLDKATHNSATEAQKIRTIADNNRIPYTKAAICRILKNRKTLNVSTLLELLTDELKRLFIPDKPLMEKAIDELIDKLFVSRSPEDNDVIIYTEVTDLP